MILYAPLPVNHAKFYLIGNGSEKDNGEGMKHTASSECIENGTNLGKVRIKWK